jgi:hypothetical protein
LAKKGVGWMAIPIFRPDGKKHGEIIRVEGVTANRKYMWPTGERTAIDIHPESFDLIEDDEAIYNRH